MPDPVSYFELGGQDAGKLREFYAELFGWKIQTPLEAAETGDYSRVEQAEGGIAGGIVRTSGNMPPSMPSSSTARRSSGMPNIDGYWLTPLRR